MLFASKVGAGGSSAMFSVEFERGVRVINPVAVASAQVHSELLTSRIDSFHLCIPVRE